MTKTNLFDLTEKVAIITGASKGIGKSIAEFFAAAGAHVVVSSRKKEAVDQVASEINGRGFSAFATACNTGNSHDITELIEATVARFGGIDILVNNAATNPVYGPVVETEESSYEKIMNVNVKGPFQLSKKVYPFLKAKRSGSIINISSIGGLRPEPGLGIYSVSKSALISLTKVLAKEWGVDNIRVNAICPGLIKTKFSQALWGNENILQTMMNMMSLKRIGTTDEIAALALFLASDASAYTTGAVFTADGGITI